MKYIFIQKNETGDSKITHEVTTDFLPDLLRHMQYFLQGCSFVIEPEETLLIESSLDFSTSGASGKSIRKRRK